MACPPSDSLHNKKQLIPSDTRRRQRLIPDERYNAAPRLRTAIVPMQWKDLVFGGRTKSMTHLQPFEMIFDVAAQFVTVKFEFGFHCFTDDKGNGEPLIHKGERRYFCPTRYFYSSQLRDYVERRFIESMAVPHYTRKGGQRYFCLDLHEYAIFFSISKPPDSQNYLRLHIISAYEVDNWGRHTLPKGKPYNVRYILQMRNNGKSV